LFRCSSKNEGGSGKTAQESGGRSKGARRVKKLRNNLKPVRFSKIPFFSLFSLILLSINSNKNKHLRRPPRRFDVPEYKNHGTNSGTKITQALDFIRLFLFQHFRLSGTSGTKPRPALEQSPASQISTRLPTPNPAKPHPATPHLAAPDTCQKRIASRGGFE
jgi:hypothetical protein